MILLKLNLFLYLHPQQMAVLSWLERRIHNPEVSSSILDLATNKVFFWRAFFYLWFYKTKNPPNWKVYKFYKSYKSKCFE